MATRRNIIEAKTPPEGKTVIEVVDKDGEVHIFRGDKTLRSFSEGTLARIFDSYGTLGSFSEYISCVHKERA